MGALGEEPLYVDFPSFSRPSNCPGSSSSGRLLQLCLDLSLSVSVELLPRKHQSDPSKKRDRRVGPFRGPRPRASHVLFTSRLASAAGKAKKARS